MNALFPKPFVDETETGERFYIPEKLTPLSFTNIYRDLTPQQRTRYNQFSGLYFLEQTIFFEQCMGRPVLEWFERRGPITLRDTARCFIDEENRHTSWFRELLRVCEPNWYVNEQFNFVKSSFFARATLRFCVRRPRLFPCLLWLQIMAEERAQYFSGAFVMHGHELDSRFVEVQRKHLADEGDHIRWDVELIEWLWPATPVLLRKFNAALLSWLLREFFYLPKRSGWQVVQRLIATFPDLGMRKAEFKSAMDGLKANPAYLRTLYPRTVFPRTRRLAAQWPELHFLDSFFTD